MPVFECSDYRRFVRAEYTENCTHRGLWTGYVLQPVQHSSFGQHPARLHEQDEGERDDHREEPRRESGVPPLVPVVRWTGVRRPGRDRGKEAQGAREEERGERERKRAERGGSKRTRAKKERRRKKRGRQREERREEEEEGKGEEEGEEGGKRRGGRKKKGEEEGEEEEEGRRRRRPHTKHTKHTKHAHTKHTKCPNPESNRGCRCHKAKY
jgi:hypothetical protein